MLRCNNKLNLNTALFYKRGVAYGNKERFKGKKSEAK